MGTKDNAPETTDDSVQREPLSEDLDEFREEPIGGDPEFDRSLQAWMDEKNHENLPCKVTLYKYRNPLTGKDMEQCNQWENEIPDQHTIGVKFGSGRYYMIISVPPGKKQRKLTTSRKFTMGPYYDELQRAERQRVFLAGAGGAGGAGGMAMPRQLPIATMAAPVDASLAILERMMAMFQPILQAAFTPRPGPGAEIVQAYQGLNHILKEQALETQALLMDSTRKTAGLSLEYEGEDGEPMEQQKPGLIETLLPAIMQIAEKVLGGGPIGAATAAAVRAAPEFKQVLNNPAQIKAVISELDRVQGTDKTNIFLKKMKVQRPK